jgi:hypothetical protein
MSMAKVRKRENRYALIKRWLCFVVVPDASEDAAEEGM